MPKKTVKKSECVILVGHGGVPKDFPKDLLGELQRLEKERLARGGKEMSPREAELDQKIRRWPRTAQTDPYQAGMERLGEKLRQRLRGKEVVVAYNEFCAPSLEEAISEAASRGYSSVRVLTIMLTPGGYHSEVEIPQIARDMASRHPDVRIQYLWPYDLSEVAELLSKQLEGKASAAR